MFQHKGSIYRITCVDNKTTLKYTVPYGGPRFSIFRKLNNKIIFNYLINNKSHLLFYK